MRPRHANLGESTILTAGTVTVPDTSPDVVSCHRVTAAYNKPRGSLAESTTPSGETSSVYASGFSAVDETPSGALGTSVDARSLKTIEPAMGTPLTAAPTGPRAAASPRVVAEA